MRGGGANWNWAGCWFSFKVNSLLPSRETDRRLHASTRAYRGAPPASSSLPLPPPLHSRRRLGVKKNPRVPGWPCHAGSRAPCPRLFFASAVLSAKLSRVFSRKTTTMARQPSCGVSLDVVRRSRVMSRRSVQNPAGSHRPRRTHLGRERGSRPPAPPQRAVDLLPSLERGAVAPRNASAAAVASRRRLVASSSRRGGCLSCDSENAGRAAMRGSSSLSACLCSMLLVSALLIARAPGGTPADGP